MASEIRAVKAWALIYRSGSIGRFGLCGSMDIYFRLEDAKEYWDESRCVVPVTITYEVPNAKKPSLF